MPLGSSCWRAPVSCGAAIFLLVLAAMHTAFAATFTVTPVRIYMKPQDRAVAVTITNESDTPILLQADLYTRTQNPDCRAETALTSAPVLSPPIIKIPAKGRPVA